MIDELPLALECKLVSYDEETELLLGEVVNVSVDERALDENGKLVECMERNELYVKDVSIPVGNGQYTTPVDVGVIEIARIDLLKYVP